MTILSFSSAFLILAFFDSTRTWGERAGSERLAPRLYLLKAHQSLEHFVND